MIDYRTVLSQAHFLLLPTLKQPCHMLLVSGPCRAGVYKRLYLGKLPTVRLFYLCAVLGFRLVVYVNKTSAWSNCKISGTGQAWLV